MARTNIRIVKFYDGSRTVKEVMNDAIASKVRKVFCNQGRVYEYTGGE